MSNIQEMEISNTSFHTRSLSLPSRPHPVNASIEDHLRRMSASQAGPSFSSSILCQDLCGVKDLYEQMNSFIHLPQNEQALSNEPLKGEVDEVLDGSLALLDISSSALEALSQMKESVLDLQSALRRGSTDEGVHAYLVSRKKISKTVSKCLVSLKRVKKVTQSESSPIALRMLKEAEAISLSTLKSVFSYVLGKKASQTRGCSMVAKLVKSKQVSCETVYASELEEIDRLLSSAPKQLAAEMKVVQKQLETLEMTIHELEDGLESVSRCLVKTRVSLLNVLNH